MVGTNSIRYPDIHCKPVYGIEHLRDGIERTLTFPIGKEHERLRQLAEWDFAASP